VTNTFIKSQINTSQQSPYYSIAASSRDFISPKSENGVTLIELLIALVISAILMTVGVPSFKGLVHSNRMTTQANEFISSMNLARSEAIKRKVNFDVVSSGTNNWGAGWLVKISGGDTLRKFRAFDGSTTLVSDGSLDTFQYQASGRANTTDTLYLCDISTGKSGRKITIATTGRVTVKNHNCT